MASMGFPRNKWTYILAAILCAFIWIATGNLIQAVITTILIFIGLYILFIILAKLF